MERDELYKIPISTLTNYRITKDGKIYSLFSKKFLKTKICNGYQNFTRTIKKDENGTQTKTFSIHRLIALVFIPNPNNYNIVNHKNENRLDNTIENLEWTTQKDNINKCKKNTSHPRKVVQLCSNLHIIYDSVTEAALEIGMSRTAISKACLKINKTAGGYEWEYYDKKYNHSNVELEDGKLLKGTPNYYIFDNGTVYNTKRKRFLKPIQNKSGYCYVTICYKNNKRNHYIHCLVGQYFIPKHNNKKLEIHHKNNIRHDNRVVNLQWVTRSENTMYIHNKASSTKLLEKSNSGSS